MVFKIRVMHMQFRDYCNVSSRLEIVMFTLSVCAQFEVRPFNFYLFPRPYSRTSPDLRFLCQSSSIDFLASQGFDFNKAFREGISHLTRSHETQLREALQQKHQTFSQFSSPAFTTPDGQSSSFVSKGPVSIPEEQKEFVKNIIESVRDFLENSEKETLELPPFNGFQRKLIYQTVRLEFTSGVHLETKTGEKKERYIVVTRVKTEQDLKKKEEEKQASEFGKLIIGHNILLDITHTLNHFFYPVPEDYQEFKAMVKSAFPKLLDTKLMASTNPFKERIFSSILGDLQKITELEPFRKPEVVFPESFDQYSSATNAKLHEAGYDAYICGLCFIMSPNRDHVFHVTFPKEWKASDLFQLFQPYGNIFIGWLDDTSAYAALSNKDNTPDVLKSLCSQENNVYKVIPYDQFKSKNNNANSVRKRPLSTELEPPPPNKKRKSLNLNFTICCISTMEKQLMAWNFFKFKIKKFRNDSIMIIYHQAYITKKE
ncbi:hypothetical protein KUTeg_003657 [Tegillarca granosa]|uniref:Poly(A)-specific ribonuclease PARN n=1 Tax=Tegillarca granosa TaxID=220873 RepID=A0ABQ9FQY4_TEGGR|nr:hypothetical protein KUTeg_003657 [Tegillarca granosa]